MTVLFESPVLLFIVCVAVEVLVARHWAQRRTPSAGRNAIIGLLLTILLPILSVAVVTDRERIEETCRQAGLAVDEGKVAALEVLLDPGFTADGLNHEDFLRRAEEFLARVRVDRVRLRNFVTTFASDAEGHKLDTEAETTFDATCAVRTADAFADSVPTRWHLKLHRTADRWLIREVHSIPVPPHFFRTLSDAVR